MTQDSSSAPVEQQWQLFITWTAVASLSFVSLDNTSQPSFSQTSGIYSISLLLLDTLQQQQAVLYS